MTSIVIFIPYFGKLPKFYNTWKVTAFHNPTVQFILFTDDQAVQSEKNIRVVHMTWKEMVDSIQSRFPFPIALKAPYKICDFRPGFAEMFPSFVEGFDFWGYCDIDLLYGDIRSFITEKVLENHDRVFYNGHISLYRNCERMNSLYRYQEPEYPAVNYEECYSSRRAFYFDEFGGMYTKCLCNNVSVFEDLSIRRDPIIAEEKFYWETVNDSNQFLILWEKGRLYSIQRGEKKELIYAHFFRRKFSVPENPENIETIVIAPGEVRFNSAVTEDDFAKAEADGYRKQYRREALKRTIKNNGIIGTLKKRKRDKDFWPYRRKLEWMIEQNRKSSTD